MRNLNNLINLLLHHPILYNRNNRLIHLLDVKDKDQMNAQEEKIGKEEFQAPKDPVETEKVVDKKEGKGKGDDNLILIK